MIDTLRVRTMIYPYVWAAIEKEKKAAIHVISSHGVMKLLGSLQIPPYDATVAFLPEIINTST